MRIPENTKSGLRRHADRIANAWAYLRMPSKPKLRLEKLFELSADVVDAHTTLYMNNYVDRSTTRGRLTLQTYIDSGSETRSFHFLLTFPPNFYGLYTETVMLGTDSSNECYAELASYIATMMVLDAKRAKLSTTLRELIDQVKSTTQLQTHLPIAKRLFDDVLSFDTNSRRAFIKYCPSELTTDSLVTVNADLLPLAMVLTNNKDARTHKYAEEYNKWNELTLS